MNLSFDLDSRLETLRALRDFVEPKIDRTDRSRLLAWRALEQKIIDAEERVRILACERELYVEDVIARVKRFECQVEREERHVQYRSS